MTPDQRERIRQDLWDQYNHLETRLASLRRIIDAEAQDVDADEVEAWAEKAQNITQGIDTLVGATYEFITLRKP
jgi:hypothetical protein